MSRSETALPPTRRHDLGVYFPISFGLAVFLALASLHPEGLSGLFLDSIFLLCGAVLSTESWQRPKAFVTNDALALRVSRVQVTHTARALMARGLSPSNAELASRFVRLWRIIGASALTRSSIVSVKSRAADGLSHHRLLIV